MRRDGNDEPEASLPGEYIIRDDAKSFWIPPENMPPPQQRIHCPRSISVRELSDKDPQNGGTPLRSVDVQAARVDFSCETIRMLS